MVNKMKNKNIFLGVIIILLIVLGSSLIYTLAFKNMGKDSNLISLSVSELEAKINNKDTFILVITQTGCSHCEQYIPELNRTLKKNNLTAYKLNITELNKEKIKQFSKGLLFSIGLFLLYYLICPNLFAIILKRGLLSDNFWVYNIAYLGIYLFTFLILLAIVHRDIFKQFKEFIKEPKKFLNKG